MFSASLVIALLAIALVVMALIGFTAYSYLKRRSYIAEDGYKKARKAFTDRINYQQKELLSRYEQIVFYEPDGKRARVVYEKLRDSLNEFQMKAFIPYSKALNVRLDDFLLSISDRRGQKHYAQRKALS